MIIWSGLGFLVAVFTFGVCLAMNLILDTQFGKNYYSTHMWAVGSALIIGGLLTSFVGFLLKTRTDREVIDVQSGQKMTINQSNHSFFFVPMHWAGMAIAIVGFGMVIYDFVK